MRAVRRAPVSRERWQPPSLRAGRFRCFEHKNASGVIARDSLENTFERLRPRQRGAHAGSNPVAGSGPRGDAGKTRPLESIPCRRRTLWLYAKGFDVGGEGSPASRRAWADVDRSSPRPRKCPASTSNITPILKNASSTIWRASKSSRPRSICASAACRAGSKRPSNRRACRRRRAGIDGGT